MKLFKVSPSRFRQVYGLPTLLGALLSVILGFGLWFSIVNNSEVERWLFLPMILLILVHLMEASRPFRFLQARIPAFDPPFAGRAGLHCVLPAFLRRGAFVVGVVVTGSDQYK